MEMNRRNIFDLFYEKIYENLKKGNFEVCGSTENIKFAKWDSMKTVKIKTTVTNMKGGLVLVFINFCYSDHKGWHSYSMNVGGLEIWKEKLVTQQDNLTFSQRRQYNKLEKICVQTFIEEEKKISKYYEIEGKNFYKRIIGEEPIENPNPYRYERLEHDEKVADKVMDKREKRCGNCKNFELTELTLEFPIKSGTCHRYPPDDHLGSYPIVIENDWCSGWIAMEVSK